MKATRADRARLVRESLALRRRLLQLLVDPAPDGDRGALPEVSVEGWRLLLKAECCALPLGEVLRRRNLLSMLDVPARDALRAAELQESQRVLAARTTLDVLDEIGSRLKIPLVALKGGALAATPGATPLDLGDVDVLVSRPDLERVWDALRARGWTPMAHATAPGAATEKNHLDPLSPPGAGLPVELHHRVRYGAGHERQLSTERIAGRAALLRLSGYDAADVLLRHSVVAHPHRRGHLRDLFLLATVLRDLTPAERETLDAGIADDRLAPELRDMLALAAALVGRTGSVPRSASERFVAWKYARLLKLDWTVDEVLPGWLSVGHIPLERGAIRTQAVRSHLRDALGPVPPGSGFRLAWPRRVPAPLRGLGGWLGRAGWRLGLLVLLGMFGWRVQRVVDDLIAPRDT